MKSYPLLRTAEDGKYSAKYVVPFKMLVSGGTNLAFIEKNIAFYLKINNMKNDKNKINKPSL